MSRPAALDPATLTADTGPAASHPFAAALGRYEARALGDVFGLTRFGVNLETLEPGSRSALRHWHTDSDEFVYVVEGDLTLVTDAGRTPVRAGMCAGFPAGETDAHHLVNESGRRATFLVIGSRSGGDRVHYPDDDLEWRIDTDGRPYAAHRDGTPY